MYGYEAYTDLSYAQLLQKVTQEQIIEWILGKSFNINKKYTSPFRDDTEPQCRFDRRPDGMLLFIDFGDVIRHRTCFKMVEDKYGVGPRAVAGLICDKFNISTYSGDYAPILISDRRETETDSEDNDRDKSQTVITYIKRQIERRDMLYWSQFLIKAESLEEDRVYPISSFTIQTAGEKRRLFNVYSVAYAIDFIDKVKIYQPYGGEYRFITNCDEDLIGNYNNLPATGEKLIISKSYKDHKVLRSLLTDSANVIWFQSENMIPNDYILTNLLSRFKRIVIFYDSDVPGFKGAYMLTNTLASLELDGQNNIDMVFVPWEHRAKDIAEYVNQEGRHDTIKLLKQIGL